jgi:hypothetical protein
MATAITIDNSGLEVAFSLTEGGPGSSVMKRLHLVHPELGTGAMRTAVCLIALTWAPLFLLCLLEGLALRGVRVPFVYDIAAHARFLLAVPVLVLADIPIGVRLRQVVRQFIAAHLIRENEKAKLAML